MELKDKNKIIYIDDDTPEAQAIKSGFRWRWSEDQKKVVILTKKTLLQMVDEAENVEDIKNIMKLILSKLP